jgi:hypothetical protein
MLGDEVNTKEWTPEEISLDPYEDFRHKIPFEGDISPYLAFQLAVEANGLMNYYRPLKAKTNLYYLQKRSKYRRTYENVSIRENSTSVADGKRRASADDDVIAARNERDYAEAYLSYMEDLMDNLEKLFYLLKQRHQEGEKGGDY